MDARDVAKLCSLAARAKLACTQLLFPSPLARPSPVSLSRAFPYQLFRKQRLLRLLNIAGNRFNGSSVTSAAFAGLLSLDTLVCAVD
jgi:hypothetical protein